MSFLRAAARPMLASYFIVSGFKALRNPEPLVGDADPVAQRLVPMVQKIAPDSVSDLIPEDTATLVRINGALQLGGGLALATGKGRRVGALLLAVSIVPSTIARHPFWTRDTAEAKAEDRSHFLKNVSLLGGVLLASADTEGKPSIAWRAQAGSERLSRKGRKTAHKTADKAKKALSHNSDSLLDSVAKTGKDLGENLQPLAGAALAGGIGLLGQVEKSTRRSRKKARKQARKTAKELSAQAKVQAKKAQALAQQQAKKAAKEAPKIAKQAKKAAAKQVGAGVDLVQVQAAAAQKQARSIADDVRSSAQDAAQNARAASEAAAKDAAKNARSTAKDVQSSAKDAAKDAKSAAQSSAKSSAQDAKKTVKKAGKLADNIQLGSN